MITIINLLKNDVSKSSWPHFQVQMIADRYLIIIAFTNNCASKLTIRHMRKF